MAVVVRVPVEAEGLGTEGPWVVLRAVPAVGVAGALSVTLGDEGRVWVVAVVLSSVGPDVCWPELVGMGVLGQWRKSSQQSTRIW